MLLDWKKLEVIYSVDIVDSSGYGLGKGCSTPRSAAAPRVYLCCWTGKSIRVFHLIEYLLSCHDRSPLPFVRKSPLIFRLNCLYRCAGALRLRAGGSALRGRRLPEENGGALQGGARRQDLTLAVLGESPRRWIEELPNDANHRISGKWRRLSQQQRRELPSRLKNPPWRLLCLRTSEDKRQGCALLLATAGPRPAVPPAGVPESQFRGRRRQLLSVRPLARAGRRGAYVGCRPARGDAAGSRAC